LPSSTTWESVTYGNGAWVAVAGGGTAGTINAYSTTAGTWVAGSALPSSAAWYGVTYSGGNFIAVGTNVAAWTNGVGGTWTAYSTQPAVAFRAIGSGQGQVVAIAYGASTVNYSSNPNLSLSISGVVIV
jgi:microcompartment protein CcmK/EutM